MQAVRVAKGHGGGDKVVQEALRLALGKLLAEEEGEARNAKTFNVSA